jgi:site-specific recombinase
MRRISEYFHFRFGLENIGTFGAELLIAANPKADLSTRVVWMVRLLRWLSDEEGRTTRLRYLLQHLEKNPALKERVGLTLRSLLRDGSALRILGKTGFSLESGLLAELSNRLLSRVLPTLPENDWAEMLQYAGWGEDDAKWIEALPPELAQALINLVTAPEGEESPWKNFRHSAREALILLASSVSHLGFSGEIRSRHDITSITNSPFLAVQSIIMRWRRNPEGLPASEQEIQEWNAALGLARQTIRAVYQHMDEEGVSVALVYRLEVISASLQRMDDILVAFTSASAADPRSALLLAGKAIRASEASASIRDHLSAHIYLLSRKIVERNGHSGEHYLAENGNELRTLFISAIGGGCVVVGMASAKILLHKVYLPPLLSAFVSWIIYSTGFLVMQFAGLTLATKLPSFLAAHLAKGLRPGKGKSQADEMVHEGAMSFLSQFVALLGNVCGLVPLSLFISWALAKTAGAALFSPAEAAEAIHDVHPWQSLAIPLGALTGIELWISSLAGGWFENWLVFRKVPEAVRRNPFLNDFFGPEKSKRLAHFIDGQSSGIAANFTLGFLFGFVPLIGMFLNLNTESRHVTIAGTSTLFGFLSVDPSSISLGLISLSALGIFGIGLMNFLVSFSLALFVAARSVGIRQVGRLMMLRIIRRNRNKRA